jgi:hypothetical protein
LQKNTNQSLTTGASNLLQFNSVFIVQITNAFAIDTTTSRFTFKARAFYKISAVFSIECTDLVNPVNVLIWLNKNGSVVTSSSTSIDVGVGEVKSVIIDEIIEFYPYQYLEFYAKVTDDCTSVSVASASNYPLGGANKINISLIDYIPYFPSARISWSSGYFNLTNSSDNQLPMNQFGGFDSNFYSPSNLSTSNSAIRILTTGVYKINTIAHYYDLGGGIKLSTSLYSSTDGTTWSYLNVVAEQTYLGSNTNEIQNGVYQLRVTSLPFYVQMRNNPSGNAPFPADLLNTITSMNIVKVANI